MVGSIDDKGWQTGGSYNSKTCQGRGEDVLSMKVRWALLLGWYKERKVEFRVSHLCMDP